LLGKAVNEVETPEPSRAFWRAGWYVGGSTVAWYISVLISLFTKWGVVADLLRVVMLGLAVVPLTNWHPNLVSAEVGFWYRVAIRIAYGCILAVAATLALVAFKLLWAG
jgi:hypothetical protein